MKKSHRYNRNVSPAVNKTGSILLIIVRLLLGLVFTFSGFVKAIDPLGSTYKFEDYFHAFGGFFDSLSIIAFPAAVILSTLELVLGLNLLFKIQLRKTAYATFIFMLVMTPITLFIALKNPVTDCGCFGDALIISNWATFYKNIALTLLVTALLIFISKIHIILLPRIQWITMSLFIVCVLSITTYCYLHLPIIDFRPYKVGVNIPKAMTVPVDAATDQYSTTFIYEQNGIQKEFTLENYPKDDTTWVFVDQKSVLLSKGYTAPVHDFTIVTADYEDITEYVLNQPEKTYLAIMYDLQKTSEKGAKIAEQKYKECLQDGSKFYALTGATDTDIQAFRKKTGVSFPFYKTDPVTLKTIIRANPGFVLLEKGTVKQKWSWRDL